MEDLTLRRIAVRRLLIGAAGTVTGAVVLAGCTGGGGVEGGALGSGESLTIITSQAPWNPAYDAVIAAYEEETGVSVDVRSYPNDEVKTQMLNDVQGGNQAYDVYQINEPDLAQFNLNEWLQPLTDIDPDFALDEETFSYDNVSTWDAEKRAFDESGVLTSVPLMGNLQVLVYRTDIYDELGLEVPETYEDVVDNARAIQEAGTAYGYVTRLQATPGASSVTYDFMPYLRSQGGTWFADEGTDWTPTIDSAEAVRAAELFREAAQLGPADTKALGQAQAIAAMQAGDAGQLQVVAAAASSMQDEANSNVVGKVGYAPLPRDPEGFPSAVSGLWTLGVPAGLDEDRSQAALEFISWVTGPEGQMIFAENGGIPTRSDAFDAPGIDETTAAYLDVVAESAENATGLFRFEFAPQFLEVAEPVLADIAAGEVEPAAGMAQLQQELTELVEESGYPMG